MFRAPRQVPFGIALAILVVSMLATSAFGQQVYGSIYGTVTDATGAAVPNAKVTITVEIEAEIPSGAPDNVVRTVTENCRTLKFDNSGFEES